MFEAAKVLLGTLFVALLQGCGGVSHIQLSHDARSRIHSVAVSDEVKMPDRPFYFGSKQAVLGALAGPAGAVIGEMAVKDEKTALKTLIADNQINVGHILSDALKTELSQTHVFSQPADGEVGDTRLILAVTSYGLFKKGAFDGALRAAIWGNAALITADGVTIWQKRFHPEAFEDRLPAHDLIFYQEHPEVLRQGFEMASTIVAKDLLEDIKRK